MPRIPSPPDLTRRTLILRGTAVAAMGVLGFQLWNLQIANGGQYRQRAEHNRLRQVTRKALRGVVYDRHGYQLVRNVPNFSAIIRPADLPRDAAELAGVLRRLGTVLRLDPGELRGRVEAGQADPYQPVRVKSYIGREAALILEEDRLQLPGVTILPTPMRQYDDGPLFGHLLGYIGPISPQQLDRLLAKQYERDDMVGLAGLEATSEGALRGRPGRLQVEVDARGRTLEVLETLIPSQPGDTIVLTVDRRLQQAAATLLAQAVERAGASGGVAAAMAPNTGEVLALVSQPGYDNNLFAAGISAADYRRLSEDDRRPLVDGAVGGLFPPGSTFKIVTAAAALQERVVRPEQTIYCPGQISGS